MENLPWEAGGLPCLNLAATCAATRALGPGLRAVVWVQGCPLNCRGCIAPEWIPFRIERLVTPEALAEELLAQDNISGLTLSGGEPMLQASGLAALTRAMRLQRDLSVICFTGYTLESLKHKPPGAGVDELLHEIDVLIDAPYVEAQNNHRGLRGSTNQRIHHLTDKLVSADFDFENTQRRTEIHLSSEGALLVGVPPTGVLPAFQRVANRVLRDLTQWEADHERHKSIDG